MTTIDTAHYHAWNIKQKETILRNEVKDLAWIRDNICKTEGAKKEVTDFIKNRITPLKWLPDETAIAYALRLQKTNWPRFWGDLYALRERVCIQ